MDRCQSSDADQSCRRQHHPYNAHHADSESTKANATRSLTKSAINAMSDHPYVHRHGVLHVTMSCWYTVELSRVRTCTYTSCAVHIKSVTEEVVHDVSMLCRSRVGAAFIETTTIASTRRSSRARAVRQGNALRCHAAECSSATQSRCHHNRAALPVPSQSNCSASASSHACSRAYAAAQAVIEG